MIITKIFYKIFPKKDKLVSGFNEIKTVRYVRVEDSTFQSVNNNIKDVKESINSLKKIIDEKDLEIKRLKNKYQSLNVKHAILQSDYNTLQKYKSGPHCKVKKT